MYAAPSEARNATVSAMSSGLPTRPNGFFAAVAASIAATSSDPMPGVLRIMGVSVNPGLTALTRMRRGASSRASVGIMVSSAPRDPAVRLLPVRLRVAPIPTVRMIEAPSDSSGSVFYQSEELSFGVDGEHVVEGGFVAGVQHHGTADAGVQEQRCQSPESFADFGHHPISVSKRAG